MKLLGLAMSLSIFLAVLGVGMRVMPGDLLCVLRTPSRLIKALLAMNVLSPFVAIMICKAFSLHGAVIVALITLSIAPVGALFSQGMLPLLAPGHAAYARGLFFASTALSVVLTPLAVEVIQGIFGGNVHVNPLSVAQVTVGSVLLPLGIGLAIAHRRPTAREWIPALQKLSSLVLLVCGVVIIAGTWSLMGSVIRQGTLTAIILITLIGLAVGHFLGGPDEEDRTVLAFATVSRHPGVAVAVASLTDQPLAPIGVLLAVLVNEVAVLPYKRWRKRLHSAAPAAASARVGPSPAENRETVHTEAWRGTERRYHHDSSYPGPERRHVLV
jgi:BASS family bile acid:Na+ symporter